MLKARVKIPCLRWPLPPPLMTLAQWPDGLTVPTVHRAEKQPAHLPFVPYPQTSQATRDFHLGPKRAIAQVPQNCSHQDLRGLVGTLFGSIFDENRSGVAVLKKWPFFCGQRADFWPFFTKSGPPNAQMS